MKKKELFKKLGVLVMSGMLVVSSMGVVYASEESASDILQKMSEVSKGVKNVSVDGALDVSAAVILGEGDAKSEMAVVVEGDTSVDLVVDEESGKPSLSLGVLADVNALGQSMELEMKMYLVPDEEGGYMAYIYEKDEEAPEGGWRTQWVSDDEVDLDLLLGTSDELESTSITFEDIGLKFELGESTVVEGEELDQVSLRVDYATLMDMVGNLEELSETEIDDGMLEDEMTKSVLESLVLDSRYFVDDSYMLRRFELDMNSSDFSFLNDLLSESMGEDIVMSLDVRNIAFNADITYDEASKEAIDSEVSELLNSGAIDTTVNEISEVVADKVSEEIIDTSESIEEGTEVTEPIKVINGEFSDGVYTVGEDVAPGKYVMFAKEDEYGFFTVYADSSMEDIVACDSVISNIMVELKEGDYFEVSGCDVVEYTGDNVSLTFPEDGMYEVGVQVEPGVYMVEVESEESGYWIIYDNLRLDGCIDNDYFEDVSAFKLEEGQFIMIENCKLAE